MTEKVRIESKKSADYHISAIYNLKSKKYIASKNQEQISLNLAIIKSETQEALITGLQARLTKGDKNKVLNLCTKKEESIKRECSYE